MKKFLEMVDNNKGEFKKFALNRLNGATKISENAKEKAGDAMLTYHHFSVKLSYYEKASKGNFNLEDNDKELEDLIKELSELNIDKSKQIDFQKLLGKIEVLGELRIKYLELKKG